MPDKHKGPIRVGILGRGRSGLDIHANWFGQAQEFRGGNLLNTGKVAMG